MASYAWCLEIGTDPPIRASTADLFEDAAVSALGGRYDQRIKADAVIEERLPSPWGAVATRAASFTLDNADGLLTSATEWRMTPATVRHYDRDTGVAVVELSGIITDVQFGDTTAVVTIGTTDAALMQELLPFAVIDPKVGSPFQASATPGAPVPVVFGTAVPIRPAVGVKRSGDRSRDRGIARDNRGLRLSARLRPA